MNSRLAIDYGAATVRAVLVAPGGTTTLTFDGAPEMSTAAHISGGGVVVTGAAAWRRAAADPDGLVISPLRAGTGQVTAGGIQVEVVDLVAVSLRQVAAEAQRVAGEPVDDVRLVVPAGWGPRRRTWMRHAARAAGLAVSRLVEAPVAAVSHNDTAAGVGDLPVGRPVLVLDVGAGCEVTVVQEEAAGPEVVSTLSDPDAGGDRLDAVLVRALTGTNLEDMPAEHRWTMLANIRAARHALSEQVAVTMPMPDGQPPMVVNTHQVDEAARPVFERVGELAAQALDNVDVTLEQVSGVYLIGAAAVTAGAGEMIGAKLGAIPRPVEPPHTAAALGAADTDATEVTGATESQPLPPLRRLITLALPGVASLALFASYIFFSDDYRLGIHSVVPLANWGVPTVAAVLALICALQAAALFAALLDQNNPTSAGQPATGRISGGIAIALLGGLATAAMFAITAGLYFNQSVARLVQGVLLSVLPVVAVVAVVAVLAWRRGVTPAGGWDGFLAFPTSSMIIAVVGIVAVHLWYTVAWPWHFAGWADGIGLAGGLLIGVAVACALVRHPGARLALTVPIGFFTVIISRTGPAPLAVIWALAVACWWGVRAWTLLRMPPVRR